MRTIFPKFFHIQYIYLLSLYLNNNLSKYKMLESHFLSLKTSKNNSIDNKCWNATIWGQADFFPHFLSDLSLFLSFPKDFFSLVFLSIVSILIPWDPQVLRIEFAGHTLKERTSQKIWSNLPHPLSSTMSPRGVSAYKRWSLAHWFHSAKGNESMDASLLPSN